MTNMEAGIVQQVFQPPEPYARKLWLVSSTTLAADIDMGAWLHQPAVGMGSVLGQHEDVYYGILARVLAAAAVEMATALSLTCSGDPRVRAFAKGLLPLAVLLMLAVVRWRVWHSSRRQAMILPVALE
ncbi:hypothetical protein ZWY2020_031915 [Hordeum vulgare]|nr:hypothetical protein ZWY2020_031915 [Hordeum vulgare]